MEAYAVIATGGKQYRVTVGQIIEIERLHAEESSDVVIDQVLALSDGAAFKFGAPIVDGAQVTITILGHKRGPKLIHFKKRRRKGYQRRMGHRQELTVAQVKTIA